MAAAAVARIESAQECIAAALRAQELAQELEHSHSTIEMLEQAWAADKLEVCIEVLEGALYSADTLAADTAGSATARMATAEGSHVEVYEAVNFVVNAGSAASWHRPAGDGTLATSPAVMAVSTEKPQGSGGWHC